MITSNVIRRVFKILHNGNTATIFTVEIDNKQYIITAKHFVDNISNSIQAKIFHENQWKNIELNLIGHCPNNIDISVLATNTQLTPTGLPCEPSSQGINYGQDVYFLGFPYDIAGDGGAVNGGFPFPVVKKAILSTVVNENNTDVFYLDGHNNPGFSGGPVVYKLPNQNQFRICGVISGYRCQQQPGYVSGSPLNIYVEENTGIIISFTIEPAVEIIRRNPKGFQL